MNYLQTHDYERMPDAGRLIGIDEAGRGCLAGPVVAGACRLQADFFQSLEALELTARFDDSKSLSQKEREALYGVLLALQSDGWIDFAVAEASVDEIAQNNILGATRLAMQRAVEHLADRAIDWELPTGISDEPLFARAASVRLLVDGRPLKPFPYTHEAIVGGDGQSLSIAMASVAAKVLRDRRMSELAQQYPAYGFEQHKGYGTQAHRTAILEHGPCRVHRLLFLRRIH